MNVIPNIPHLWDGDSDHTVRMPVAELLCVTSGGRVYRFVRTDEGAVYVLGVGCHLRPEGLSVKTLRSLVSFMGIKWKDVAEEVKNRRKAEEVKNRRKAEEERIRLKRIEKIREEAERYGFKLVEKRAGKTKP